MSNIVVEFQQTDVINLSLFCNSYNFPRKCAFLEQRVKSTILDYILKWVGWKRKRAKSLQKHHSSEHHSFGWAQESIKNAI